MTLKPIQQQACDWHPRCTVYLREGLAGQHYLMHVNTICQMKRMTMAMMIPGTDTKVRAS